MQREGQTILYILGVTNFNGDRVHYRLNSDTTTALVGNYPSGKSWVGALDMSGNLWEWTSSLSKDYPYITNDGRELIGNEGNIIENIILRSGSFGRDSDGVRAADRGREPAGFGSKRRGFRCARS